MSIIYRCDICNKEYTEDQYYNNEINKVDNKINTIVNRINSFDSLNGNIK